MDFWGYLFDLDCSRRRKINNLKDYVDANIRVTGGISRNGRFDCGCYGTGNTTSEMPTKSLLFGQKKRHTLKNQIIINRRGKIMDTTDSSAGKNHDKKIFDKSRFMKSIPKDIDIMGDSGYQGIKDDSPDANIPLKKNRGGPELNKEQKRENRKIARKRARIENVIRKVKSSKFFPTDTVEAAKNTVESSKQFPGSQT